MAFHTYFWKNFITVDHPWSAPLILSSTGIAAQISGITPIKFLLNRSKELNCIEEENTTPACFSTFFSISYGPYSSWKFQTLYSSTNQQLFKKNFWNQRSHFENYVWFPLQIEAITCLPQNRYFLWRTKMNGTQRRALVSPWRMHYMYSGMAKGTSGAEAASNSEKTKPVYSLSHCWITRVWRYQSGS